MEIPVENIPGNFSQIITVGAVFHHDRQSDLGIIHRGECDKDSVVYLVQIHLGSTGFGANGNIIVPENIGSGAVTGGHQHSFFDFPIQSRIGSDLTEDLRGDVIQYGPVIGGHNGTEDMHAISLSVCRNGRRIRGQLQGSEQMVGLADGGLEGIAHIPGFPDHAFFVFFGSQRAFFFEQLDPGRLTETIVRSIPVKNVDPHSTPDDIEEIVAGDLECFPDVDGTMGAGIDPAGIRISLVLVDDAPVVDLGICGDSPFPQPGGGSHHLEGRTRSIGALKGAVEQRSGWI